MELIGASSKRSYRVEQNHNRRFRNDGFLTAFTPAFGVTCIGCCLFM